MNARTLEAHSRCCRWSTTVFLRVVLVVGLILIAELGGWSDTVLWSDKAFWPDSMPMPG